MTATPTVVPVPASISGIGGLVSWFRLDELQGRGSGSCATNWPSLGSYGLWADVVWNACPYMWWDTAGLANYRPAYFDTGRSMRMSIGDWTTRSEWSIFYLARMAGNPHAIMQSNNYWFAGE